MLNKKLRILSTAILTVGVGLGVVSCGDPSTSTTGTQGTDETKQTTEEYTTSVDTQALLDAYAEAAVTEINAVSEEEKTLSMGCSTEDEAFVRTVIEDFKTEFPELAELVTFEINNQVGEADTFKAFSTDANAAPDVVLSADDQLVNCIVANYVNPIPGPMVNVLRQELTSSSLTAVEVNGKYYGYPAVGGNSQIVLYRKDKIDLETVDSLDAILEACKAAGKTFYFPLQEGWYISDWLWLSEGDMKIDIQEVEDPETGEKTLKAVQTTTFTKEGLREVGDALNGYFTKYDGTLLTTNGTNVTTLMQNDMAAEKCWGGVSWNNYNGIVSALVGAGYSEDEAKDMIGIAKIPTVTYKGEEVQLETWDSYKVYAINRVTKLPTLANLVAYWFTSAKSQLEHFNVRQYFPTNKEVLENETVNSSELTRALSAIAPYTHSQAQGLTGDQVWTGLTTFGTAFGVNGTIEEDAATSAVDALFSALGGVLA